MNVFSAFNGIGCGFVALERAGIKVDKYYSAEIDQRAIKVNDKNWPRTIQFGDITKIRGEHFMSPIDLLMGGSPCQDLSIAGKMAGLEGKRSGLFYEFIRLKDELKPKYFFFENVRMKKKEQDIITNLFGCEPIYFDSALVSAQTRKRLYWTNIVSKEDFVYPEDRGIVLIDILDFECEFQAIKGNELNYFKRNKDYLLDKSFISIDAEKALTVRAREYANWKGNYISNTKRIVYVIACTTMVEYEDTYRKLTPIEVERCFNLPDNYTKGVSNSARYHGLGNGWEVATIVEFFKHLPDEYKTTPLS